MATRAIELPAHIDPATVRHCALFDRRLTHDNPYETIIPAIHQGPAVFFADNVMFRQPGWVVRRNADLREILVDAEHFTKSGAYGLARLLGEDWNVIPTELDPPVHTAFRTALNPLFSPSRMMALDGRVRERARAFVDRFKRRGECELVREFAVVFPISIFLDLLGLPQDRLEQCYEWECGLIHGADMDTRTGSMRAIKALLLETIAARKANPGEDLISQALTLEVDGRKWTDDEIFGYCVNLYLGGLDTVTANIGLQFRHLATHPDDQKAMRNNSSQQNVVAIEELLRAYAVTSTNRICIKPYDVAGERIMPGDYVITSPAIAGRDPEAYDAPQEIRLDRRPSHLTLGHGIHRCLGQHLARRELQTAIEVFLGEIPSFRIEPGHKVEYFLGNILHVPELPLTWT